MDVELIIKSNGLDLIALGEDEMARKLYDRHLGIRFDSETHDKLRYIASYEGRSLSAHVLYVLRQSIREFERVNGQIPYPVEDGKDESR